MKEFLEVKLKEKAYLLVGCNLAGVNAFFVRSDLVGDMFLEPYSAENHYEPARYHLVGITSGHRPSHHFMKVLAGKGKKIDKA